MFAEQIFSTVVKQWLNENRLNHFLDLHIHKDLADELGYKCWNVKSFCSVYNYKLAFSFLFSLSNLIYLLWNKLRLEPLFDLFGVYPWFYKGRYGAADRVKDLNAGERCSIPTPAVLASMFLKLRRRVIMSVKCCWVKCIVSWNSFTITYKLAFPFLFHSKISK